MPATSIRNIGPRPEPTFSAIQPSGVITAMRAESARPTMSQLARSRGMSIQPWRTAFFAFCVRPPRASPGVATGSQQLAASVVAQHDSGAGSFEQHGFGAASEGGASSFVVAATSAPAPRAVVSAAKGRAMPMTGPRTAQVNAIESTPDSGVEIAKAALAPLLAP